MSDDTVEEILRKDASELRASLRILSEKNQELELCNTNLVNENLQLKNEVGQLIQALQKMREASDRRDKKTADQSAIIEELQKVAHNDPLTGVLNRLGMDYEFSKVTKARNREQLAPSGTLAYIDCNRFKFINDYISHDVGDDLLVALCSILRSRLRPTDLIARIGGDEFLIFLIDSTETHARSIMDGILERAREVQIEHENLNIFRKITASSYLLDFSAGFAYVSDAMQVSLSALTSIAEKNVPKFAEKRNI